jgi:hypothetical protein
VRKLLWFLFVLGAFELSAQTNSCFDPHSKDYYKSNRTEAKICVEYLLADLEELEEKLLTVHPDPFAYCGKTKFDSAYTKAFSFYNEGRTLIEHAQNLNRFIRVVEDSHLQAYVFGLLHNARAKESGFLPLFIQPIQGKFYIEEDYIHGPPVGSEILSIGKLSMHELHNLAKEWCIDEGNAMNASEEAAGNYYTPAQFFANPTQKAGQLEMVKYSFNNTIDSVPIALINYKELQKNRNNYFQSTKTNIQSTFLFKEKKAILKINSFVAQPFHNDYKKIWKFFEKTKELGIRNIAIDVRNNPGGSSAMVEYLCSFLFRAGMNTPNNIIWKTSDYSYKLLSKFGKKHFPKLIERHFNRNGDYYQYYVLSQTPKAELDTAFFHIPLVQPIEWIYTGTVTLFMNGNTASAACDFAQLLQNNERAKLVGTPCNASANGTWGNTAPIQLYETGVSFSLPTIRYNYDDTFNYSRTPILPDIGLVPSVSDIISGKDTFREFFLKN